MSRRVVILGGGVIGLCCAWYAAKRGHRVLVVERLPAQRDGCSYGNAGMIVPSHFVPLAAPGMVAMGLRMMRHPESPFYIQPRLSWDLLSWGWRFWRAATPGHVRRAGPLLRDLHLASRSAYQELDRELGHSFGLTQNGLFMLCRTPRAFEEEAHAADQAHRLGIAADVLTAAQTAQREPDIQMDIVGSVYFPGDCHLAPHQFMMALQERLPTLGVEFQWGTEVVGWRTRGRRIEAVQTHLGDLEGDEFLLCGGSWSPIVAAVLGLRLPMQAGKGYSLTVTQPRQLPRTCAILTEARVAVTPMGSSLRFGGTMEIAGLTQGINPLRVRGIVKAASDYYPAFQEGDFARIEPWSGLRPCSPDGLPYLGRTRRYSNLTVATGHAMMGLSLGPVTGQIVTDLLCEEPTQFDLRLLSPDRFPS